MYTFEAFNISCPHCGFTPVNVSSNYDEQPSIESSTYGRCVAPETHLSCSWHGPEHMFQAHRDEIHSGAVLLEEFENANPEDTAIQMPQINLENVEPIGTDNVNPTVVAEVPVEAFPVTAPPSAEAEPLVGIIIPQDYLLDEVLQPQEHVDAPVTQALVKKSMGRYASEVAIGFIPVVGPTILAVHNIWEGDKAMASFNTACAVLDVYTFGSSTVAKLYGKLFWVESMRVGMQVGTRQVSEVFARAAVVTVAKELSKGEAIKRAFLAVGGKLAVFGMERTAQLMAYGMSRTQPGL